jgi:hypothetical protein
LSFLYFYSKSKYADNKYSTCKHFFKVQYKGKIAEIHERGRTNPIYMLRDGDWFWPYLHRDSVELILKVGDSIYKPSNSFDLYIYKNANPDSVIFISIEYDCNSLVEEN